MPVCSICTREPEVAPAIYRCVDGLGRPDPVCCDCCLAMHRCFPLHVVEVCVRRLGDVIYIDLPYQKLVDSQYTRTTLVEMGLLYNIGHEAHDGEEGCKQRSPGKLLLVVDVSAIHAVAVAFCGCIGAPSRELQLHNIQWELASAKQKDFVHRRWLAHEKAIPDVCLTHDFMEARRAVLSCEIKQVPFLLLSLILFALQAMARYTTRRIEREFEGARKIRQGDL